MEDLLPSTTRRVALRKESVDRNKCAGHRVGGGGVALRKESVDRNKRHAVRCGKQPVSLSARRAWIEMQQIWQRYSCYCGRSPQGERG